MAQDHRFNSWLLYNGDHRIHGKWGVRIEGQTRRQGITVPRQYVVRTGVNYSVTDRVMVTLGYARVNDENRMYQQALLNARVKATELQYQLRVEQRWLPQRYQNRVRLQFRVLRNLRGSYYFTASDAVYLHIGAFDQNRAYGALGLRLNRYNRVETGYLLQSIRPRGGGIWAQNHTLQIAFYSTLPFGD